MNQSRQKSWVRVVLAILFAFLSLNGAIEAWDGLTSGPDHPRALTAFQAVIGITALAAAVGTWRLTKWAPVAAVAYGVIAGTMLATLPMMLGLDAEARGGIWLGAMVVLAFGVSAGLYLRKQR